MTKESYKTPEGGVSQVPVWLQPSSPEGASEIRPSSFSSSPLKQELALCPGSWFPTTHSLSPFSELSSSCLHLLLLSHCIRERLKVLWGKEHPKSCEQIIPLLTHTYYAPLICISIPRIPCCSMPEPLDTLDSCCQCPEPGVGKARCPSEAMRLLSCQLKLGRSCFTCSLSSLDKVLLVWLKLAQGKKKLRCTKK